MVKKFFFILAFVVSCLYGQEPEIDIPRIKYVSVNVNTGNIEIKFEKSETPEVEYYTVNYEKYTGNNPMPSWVEIPGIVIGKNDIPFVSFSTDLIDVSIDTTPVAFAVEAHVDDITSSQVDLLAWDSTILLKGQYDTCLSQITLSWNKYDFNMWSFDEFVYRIYVSENGGPYLVNTTVTKYITEFTLTNLLPDNDYSIYVCAIPGFPGERSDSVTSTRIDINTYMARIPDYIYEDYATYTNGNVEVQFTVDPNAELEQYMVLRSTAISGTYDTVAVLPSVNGKVNYIDDVDFLSGPYYYRLLAFNYCGILVEESEWPVANIVMVNTGEPLQPELFWNNGFNLNSGSEEFILERRFGDEDFQQLSQLNTTNYTDNEIETLVGVSISHNVCYRLTAIEHNYSGTADYQSVSNTVCIELPINLRFEYDAFIPGDPMNGTFGPVMDFPPDEFSFKIQDRNGRVVYESEDAADCLWDGTFNGANVSMGAYMYVVQYRIGNGKRQTIRGGLAVVYP
ncbi:MAG: gliding motility-associated C-terminal domain-containing protein [Bacteroidales bacterium]|nr:gliding motility-associated C-terminal domain-containing protein [Bacteroidales bacterium]MBN2821105.1 gliding motility-associated C-terminal domain-containing protein [Bacteroidales bacterium]